MSRVLKEVIAEVRAKSDQYQAEMAKVEARAKQTKVAIEGVGSGSAQAGQRSAEAARQIASATENIARAGQVTGEAGKQIVSQAANIAFAFGPQGAIIGALGIFALAWAQTMNRAKEELKALERESLATFNSLAGMDSKALQARAGRIRGGEFETWDISRIWENADGADERRGYLRGRGLDRLQRDLEGRARMVTEAAGNGRVLELRTLVQQRDEIRAVIKKLEHDLAITDQLERARKKSEEAAAAKDAAKKGERARDTVGIDGGRMSDELERDVAAFAQDFAKVVVRELGTAGDDVRAEFNALIQQALDAGRENAVDQLIELRDAAVGAARAIASSEAALQDVDLAAAQGIAPTVAQFERLTDEVAALQAQLAQLAPNTARYREVLAQIEKVEAKRTKMMQGVANAGSGNAPASRPLADYARELQQAVDGALQLAAAFGAVDEATARALRSVSQIVGNLPALSAAIQAGNGMGIVTAALPIMGALSSLVGESPADAQRREELRKNTEALERLTKATGLLTLNVSGSTAGVADAGLRRFLDNAPGLLINYAGNARRAATANGLDLTELDRIAAAMGITLNENIASFQRLAQAIREASGKLAEFGDDLDSQLQQADAAATVFGITDPLERLGLRTGAYGGRSPILDQALAGLDLSTAEGRAAARRALQDIFRVMQSGGAALTEEQLGGLDGDQLLQAILDLITSLNDVDESLGLNTSTVGNPDRVITADATQITVDQASRLLGVQTSALAELRIIRAALTASLTGPPLPDLVGDLTAGSGAVTITISQEFHGVGREVATTVRDATLDAIDAGLGRRVLMRERFTGQAVRS